MLELAFDPRRKASDQSFRVLIRFDQFERDSAAEDNPLDAVCALKCQRENLIVLSDLGRCGNCQAIDAATGA